MAAHEIRCSKVHETHFPLVSNAGHSWVSVASTLPTETRVLKHLGGRNSLETLKRSVDSRFMHDPKLLPVAGVETARKLLDETLPSNTLMPSWEASAKA